MICGTLLLLGTVCERRHYKPLERRSPGPGWVATEERFVDEDTGQTVRVWMEPRSGERKYVRTSGALSKTSSPGRASRDPGDPICAGRQLGRRPLRRR